LRRECGAKIFNSSQFSSILGSMNQQKKITNIVGPLRDENSKLVTISGTIEKTPNRSGIIESSSHEAGIEDKQF